MTVVDFLRFRWLGVPYTPRPEEHAFLERAQVQRDDEPVVRVAVLDHRESHRVFGVPLARRGMQPAVWLHVSSHGAAPLQSRSSLNIR
jgi:hypothetical protein